LQGATGNQGIQGPIGPAGAGSDYFGIKMNVYPYATSAFQVLGGQITTSPTAVVLPPLANSLYYEKLIGELLVTSSATALAHWREGNTTNVIINKWSLYSGFNAKYEFGFAQGAVATTLFYYGMTHLTPTQVPTQVNPSSLLNNIGIGFDISDKNFNLFENNASGVAVKTDTGIPRPTSIRDNIYYVEINAEKNATKVTITLTRKNDGLSFTADLVTKLPSVYLSARSYHSAGTTPSSVGFGIRGWQCQYK
jgi:hypothetical protein